MGLLGFSTPGYAQKIVDDYPVHSRVDVYYNSNQTKDAYLEKEMGFGILANALMGLVFISIGIYLS